MFLSAYRRPDAAPRAACTAYAPPPDHLPPSGGPRPLAAGRPTRDNHARRLSPSEAPMSTTPAYSPGLEGVIAGETAISTIEGGLRYRGYPVGELAERCTFDEVAYLLL